MDIKKIFAAALFSAMMPLPSSLFICAGDSSAETPRLKTYGNSETGLAFEYPSDYILKELLTPKGMLIAILIGKAEGGENRWLLDIGIDEMGTYQKRRVDLSVKQFAAESAINHCASDGPDGAVRCEDIVKMAAYSTAHGFSGYEFYLDEISEHYSEGGAVKTEKRVKGPIYAFDVSKGGAIRILLIEPTDRTREYPQEEAALKELVRSLRIISAPQQ